MANLNDAPAVDVRNVIREIIDRQRCKDQWMATAESWSLLTIEQARMLWWAAKWLELIAEGKVQDTDFSIDYCRRFLIEKVKELKSMPEDGKVLHLTRRGIMILVDVEQHLDTWVLAREFDDLKRQRGETSNTRSNGVRKRAK